MIRRLLDRATHAVYEWGCRCDRRWQYHHFIHRSPSRAYLFAITGVWL